MKLLMFIQLFCLIWLTFEFNSLQIKSRNLSNLPAAVNELFSCFFALETLTVNVISAQESSSLKDFQDSLLLRCFSSTTSISCRQQTADSITLLSSGQRRRNNVFLIRNFYEFLSIYKKISPTRFRFNGFFAVIFIDGKISETEEIYNLFWKLQIYNVITMHEANSDAVIVETFDPFNAARCDDTSPVVINEFRRGKFINGAEFLFPSKFRNMGNCALRVATTNESVPYVFIDRFDNGSINIYGRDIDVVNTLSERLNFQINYTFLGLSGYFYDNGTSEGPLKVLLDGEADLAVGDLWLKPNRVKYFDATEPYFTSHVIFVIPPGREFTKFEKLIFPFAASLWTLICTCFFIGVVIILLVKLCPQSIQNFVFGVGVRNPYFNMIVGYVGGFQNILPRTNFARFLLTMLLIYSLVIRTLYHGSFYHRMQSIESHKEVQTIDEMIDQQFTFFIYDYSLDLFNGTERVTKR